MTMPARQSEAPLPVSDVAEFRRRLDEAREFHLSRLEVGDDLGSDDIAMAMAMSSEPRSSPTSRRERWNSRASSRRRRNSATSDTGSGASLWRAGMVIRHQRQYLQCGREMFPAALQVRELMPYDHARASE